MTDCYPDPAQHLIDDAGGRSGHAGCHDRQCPPVRNIGTSVGISFLQIMTIRNAGTVQSRLVEGVKPDNPVLDLGLPDFDFTSMQSVAGVNHEIARQAMMVGYVESFWFLFLLSLVLMPIIWLMRPPKLRQRSD